MWVPRWQLRRGKGEGQFCSRDCKFKGSTALGRPRSPEPIRHSQGYLLEWAPDHPRQSRGRVLQHILVAERMIGRPLKDGEQVHHINGQRDDNRPENLEVLPYNEHQKRHWDDPNHRKRHSERMKREVRPRDPVTGRWI